MLTVHLRINDAATGQPTPVRLRVTSEDGGYFVPLGQHAEFPTGIGETVGGALWLARERWCYTNGSSEMLLPAGVPLRIQATKGPCFAALDETVTLKPGQMTLRFEIHRKLDDNGWVSGDGRTHFLTPHGATLEGQAEDVRFTNLLALDFAAAALDGQTYHSTPNMEAFSGQADQAVPVNTFNQHPVLGRVSLLSSHRPVHPLVFGAPDVSDDWSLSDWCDQCKRKGGLPVWVAPFETSAEVVGGEGLVALLNGNLSTIELDGQARFQPILPHWYRLLNAGFRVGLLGASGKKSNRLPVGGMRTYVRGATTYAEWIHGVREGENFITNGPLVDFTREGQELHATARSLAAFDTLEILGNGVPIATTKPAEEGGVWRAKLDVTIDRPAIWHAARVGGAKSFLNPEQPAFAHSSPIYSVDPPPFRRSASDVAPWRKALETTLNWIENHAQFTNPKSRERLLSYTNSAMAKLA